MSGKWSEEKFPKRGWVCVSCYSLDPGETQTCDMCEVQEIRHIHVMEHKDAGELECGCVCAGKMEKNERSAKERERKMLNLDSKRRRFVSGRKWRVSKKGNEYIKIDGVVVTVFEQNGLFKFVYQGMFSDGYEEKSKCKSAAFNAVAGIRP